MLFFYTKNSLKLESKLSGIELRKNMLSFLPIINHQLLKFNLCINRNFPFITNIKNEKILHPGSRQNPQTIERMYRTKGHVSCWLGAIHQKPEMAHLSVSLSTQGSWSHWKATSKSCRL